MRMLIPALAGVMALCALASTRGHGLGGLFWSLLPGEATSLVESDEDDSEDLDPNDCSRGIDEANQTACSDGDL